VAAALIYSVYILVGSRVLQEEEPLGAATVVMLAAAVVFGLGVVLESRDFPASARRLEQCAGDRAGVDGAGHGRLFAGMKRLGASDAATLSTLEPVVTFVLAGGLFLDEPVTLIQVRGGCDRARTAVIAHWRAAGPRFSGARPDPGRRAR
jgi:drug/metabolite transporter (DMT)-like permease